MRAIIVDDEPLMLKKFVRLSDGIEGFYITGMFDTAKEAIRYVKDHPVEAVFLDIDMPGTDGIAAAKTLRSLQGDIMIVFVTAYDEYIREANELNSDHYIVKPYTQETIRNVVRKLELLSAGQHKDIYVQTFGRFMVKKNGEPVRLTGKAKEILALIVTKRGKEISNEEIFRTIWEGRPYSNANMSVYYNALHRLKLALSEAGIREILVSTPHGQTVDTSLFDCDYYSWQDNNTEQRDAFEGEFMSEYSWGEYTLASIYRSEWTNDLRGL